MLFSEFQVEMKFLVIKDCDYLLLFKVYSKNRLVEMKFLVIKDCDAAFANFLAAMMSFM